jgi:hypothetical protein
MRPRVVPLLMLPVVLLIASTGEANAYIGPGAGLSAIGSVVSVVSAMLLAVAGFVWYPLKRLLRRRRPRPPASAAVDPRINPEATEATKE